MKVYVSFQLSRAITFGSAVQFIRYEEVDDNMVSAVTMGWGATYVSVLKRMLDKIVKTKL